MNKPAEMHMRIGDILVAMGDITRNQLNDALARQEISGRQLGAELISAGCLTPARLANGLHLQRMCAPAVSLALVFGVFAVNLPAEAADSNDAVVMVSANVIRHASVRMLFAAQTVSISAADIARGYVDIPLPSKLEIRSNSPNGYLLAIESEADFARGTEVRGLGDTVSFGPSGGVINVKADGAGMRQIPVELRFRVLLSDAARPGIHPWPLHLSVMPL